MINGIVSPYLNIPQGMTRLRIVNGSNATNFDIDINGKTFYQIGSDGGFLNFPVKLEKLTLVPGERAEIIVDSKDFKDKDYLYINNTKALEFRKTGEKSVDKLIESLVEIPTIKKI